MLHKKNEGLSSARNAGIEIAKGDYIGFVDSDDYIHEKMYEILYTIAMKHSSDLAVCDYLRVNEDQIPSIENYEMTSCIEHFTNIQALKQLFPSNNNGKKRRIGLIIACNKLYKRDLFKDLRFPQGRIFEDEFIAHKILYNSKKITFISSKLYYYVQRSESILNSSFTIKRFDKVYALKDRADFLKAKNEWQLYNQALKIYMDTFFWYYFKLKLEYSYSNKELKKLKKTLDRNIIHLLNNPLIGWKQKFILIAFFFNPTLLSFYKEVK